MPRFVSDGPIWLVVAFLLIVVFCRAQATYWVGRAIARGAVHAGSSNRFLRPVLAWFSGPGPDRGRRALNRWGPVIIPLSFLTVGFQTAVNAAAGLLVMPWRRYTLAMLPGCVAWALLYGLGLLAVWVAAINAVAGSWWMLLALALIAALAVVVRRIVRRRRGGLFPPAP